MGRLEERNKDVVSRFARALSRHDRSPALDDFLAPRCRIAHRPFHHLACNAQAQGRPGSPASSLRLAFAGSDGALDRTVAEGCRVAISWRTGGVHHDDLFGIAPTGRRYGLWHAALFHLANDKITEAWFMTDELGLLLDLEVGLPAPGAGAPYRPPPSVGRTAPEALWDELRARPSPTREVRNKIALLDHKVAYLGLKPGEDIAAFEANRPVRRNTSGGSRLFHAYGKAKGFPYQAPQAGLRDRLDHIDDLVGEGDLVFQHYTFSGRHDGTWYGLAPTGRFVGTMEMSFERFGEESVESWYCVDELGLALQMDALEPMLEARRHVNRSAAR